MGIFMYGCYVFSSMRLRGAPSITLQPTKHFSRHAAIYFDLLGESCLFYHLHCMLFSFSCNLSFRDLKNVDNYPLEHG